MVRRGTMFAWLVIIAVCVGLVVVLLSEILANPTLLLWLAAGVILAVAVFWAWTILEQDSYR